MAIYVERVKPIRLGKDNILILHRLEVTNRVEQISNEIANNVVDGIRVYKPQANVIYGLKYFNRRMWRRAVLRFTRDDGIDVMDFIDGSGQYSAKMKF